MLTKPHLKALRALHTFAGHPGWADVEDYLKSELDAVFKALAEAVDETTLRQLQGRAQFIQEFLRQTKTSASLIEKLRGSSL